MGSVTILPSIEDLDASAKSLLQNAVENYHPTFGTGSMSCSIYDTAWVSLLTKTGDDGQSRQWLFPECFFYILETQSEDGSWGRLLAPSSGDSQIDGILCTAASLLSLLRHQSLPLQLEGTIPADMSQRATKALASLRSQLKSWDVVSTVHVGFEVIVPALLHLLKKESPSMDLNFDGFGELMRVNTKKMSRFRPEYLYAENAPQMTVLHSMEAFSGSDSEPRVDFDRLAHHKRLGSMMGSPASTAAYLMNVSRWDDEAEGYLRHVVKNGPGRSGGGVPSAYPSTYFEFSWVLSTLFTSGYSPASLESPALSKMVQVLSRGFENEGGTIGFAPHFLADVDDTAKAITCLRMLNRDADPSKMIESFESDTHFKTYPCERNPSFSANCNALLALLHQEKPGRHATQTHKAVGFLCEYWWNSTDKIQDKWNLSHLYPTLLFVDALMTLVELVESGDLPAFQDEILRSKIAICLYQACYRALLDQNEDTGSWNGSLEETAYGTMILSQATRLDLFRDFDDQFHSALHRAVSFLQPSCHEPPRTPERNLWVEKVGYSSPVLAETYRLAALRRAYASLKQQGVQPHVGTTLRQDTTAIPKLSKLLHHTPLFGSVPEWEIRASMVEGTLFRPMVRELRLSVFTRKGVEEDKYFDIIPLAWPSCNNCMRIFAPSCFLFEGMMAAMLNYQVDEFMEAVAGVNYAGDIPKLRDMIDEVVTAVSREAPTPATNHLSNGHVSPAANGDHGSLKSCNGHGPDTTSDVVKSESKRQEVLIPLQKFCRRALHHPAIRSASFHDRKNVISELRIYLQTHVTQSEDNLLLQQGKFRQHIMRDDHSFFRWVRTTSADHTSATYTFYFWTCLLSSWVDKTSHGEGRPSDCFESATEKYYAAAMCQHMAALCRMYNDHGSVSRDRDEGNLNSVDFPEFDAQTSGSGVNGVEDAVSTKNKKAELFQLAQYERSCLEDAFRRLSSCNDPSTCIGESAFTDGVASTGSKTQKKERKLDILRLLWTVTDLWGQMYVLRDLGSRLTVNG
ncbi:ent-kaurene synthase [Naviculisporaceae sp. PSN 640]